MEGEENISPNTKKSYFGYKMYKIWGGCSFSQHGKVPLSPMSTTAWEGKEAESIHCLSLALSPCLSERDDQCGLVSKGIRTGALTLLEASIFGSADNPNRKEIGNTPRFQLPMAQLRNLQNKHNSSCRRSFCTAKEESLCSWNHQVSALRPPPQRSPFQQKLITSSKLLF